MKRFVVYGNDSGVILRSGVCPDEMFDVQAMEGETVIEGEANDITDLVDIKTQKILPEGRMTYAQLEENRSRETASIAETRDRQLKIQAELEKMAMERIEKQKSE
jgi:hypothetical protein